MADSDSDAVIRIMCFFCVFAVNKPFAYLLYLLIVYSETVVRPTCKIQLFKNVLCHM